MDLGDVNRKYKSRIWRIEETSYTTDDKKVSFPHWFQYLLKVWYWEQLLQSGQEIQH